MNPIFLSVVRLAPANPVADSLVAAPASPNADLIASLPRSELDALLPVTQNNGVTHFAPDPVTRGADQVVALPLGLKDASLGRAPDAEVKVGIGGAAVTRDLLTRAREAGLSDAELAQLDAILRSGGNFNADAALVAKLLDTHNAARALRTFIDLASLRQHYPKRITPDIVETLAMGVGRARSGVAEGSEGVLSPAQAHQAAMALAEMSSRDYEAIRYSLFSASELFKTNPNADCELQSALLLKAVAARRGSFSTADAPASFKLFGPSKAAQEIADFASRISNVDADVLVERTSGIDLDGDGSAATVLQMARAEVDPIYAWRLHGDGQDGSAQTMTDAISPSTGVAYVQKSVADSDERRAAAVDHIERMLEIGVDVPIAVTSSAGDNLPMLVTDVRGSGATREFLISDPSSGRTAWVACSDIVNGNLDGAGAKLSGYWW